MQDYSMLYQLNIHDTFKNKKVPKGMTEIKKNPDGTIEDSNGRKYIKVENGSLRRKEKR